MNQKFENIAVVTKAFGDYKVLAFISGNTKSEVIQKMKNNLNIRMNGIVWLQDERFPKGFNSNKF